MSETLRFPFPRSRPNISPPEHSQIITILPAVGGTLKQGGEAAYVSIAPWKWAGDRNTETVYSCVAIEFSANAVGTLGNGTTEMIGLFGQIDLIQNPTFSTDRKRSLLAVLGINLGSVMPQVPIINQTSGDIVGFTQLISGIAVYDRLSIGGVLGDVLVPEGLEITVIARPIRRRQFVG